MRGLELAVAIVCPWAMILGPVGMCVTMLIGVIATLVAVYYGNPLWVLAFYLFYTLTGYAVIGFVRFIIKTHQEEEQWDTKEMVARQKSER